MKNLKKLREMAGLSQQKFGNEIGLARNTICQYESGNRVPDVDTLIKIAEFFGVSVDYVLGRDYSQSSYEIFVDVCIKENRTTKSVAEEFGITEIQLANWKCGVTPSKQTLWAIANKYNYRLANPFDKAKENSPTSLFSNEFSELFTEQAYIDFSKLYKATKEQRLRQCVVDMFAGILDSAGYNSNEILEA